MNTFDVTVLVPGRARGDRAGAGGIAIGAVHVRQDADAQRRFSAGRQGCCKQSYCKLAAQASARARRSELSDPLNGVEEINPQVLKSMGISEAQIQAELASGYENWIEPLVSAGDYASALKVAEEALRANWSHLDRARTAQLYLLAGRLYWKQKKYVHGLFVALRAMVKYPPMTKRFIKALGRRLGVVARRSA